MGNAAALDSNSVRSEQIAANLFLSLFRPHMYSLIQWCFLAPAVLMQPCSSRPRLQVMISSPLAAVVTYQHVWEDGRPELKTLEQSIDAGDVITEPS